MHATPHQSIGSFKAQVKSLMYSCAFSHLAYYDRPYIQQKLKRLPPAKLITAYEPSCTNDVHAFLFRSGSKMILSFKGTTNKNDFKDALDIRHSYFEEIGTRIHRGFYQRFKLIEPLITEDLQTRLKTGTETTELLITGHSMGGALAAIACGYYGKHFRCSYPQIALTCHTFGNPHFADERLGEVLHDCTKEHICVHSCNDLVPYLPIHQQFKHLPYVLELHQDSVVSCLIHDRVYYIDLLYKLMDIKDINALFKQHSCLYYYEKLGALLKRLENDHRSSPS